jgi:hypothetical protein
MLTFLIHSSMAATVEDYLTKSPEDKIAILRSKPDRFLSDPKDILRLYTASLNDRSEMVQREAARSAAFLVMGLQAASNAGGMPKFSIEDSNNFQQALTSKLDNADDGTRIAVFTAIAYSSPPVDVLDAFLQTKIEAQSDTKVKAQMLETLGKTQRKMEWIWQQALDLLKTSTDSKTLHSSASILADTKPEMALDDLIQLALKASPIQWHAIQVLRAYGAKAAKAKSAFEALIKDQAAPEDIRNLARISLEAINTDKPQPSSLQMMKLTALWPLALGSSPKDAPKQTAPVVNPPPTPQSSSPKKAADATPSEEPASSTPWGIIVVLIVAATCLLSLLVKKRK